MDGTQPHRLVNVCLEGAEDWLFGDLKLGFPKHQLPGLRVIATETPVPDADAWIYIRTSEAASSPDLERTVVCIHDLYQHGDSYSPNGDRSAVRKAAAIVAPPRSASARPTPRTSRNPSRSAEATRRIS